MRILALFFLLLLSACRQSYNAHDDLKVDQIAGPKLPPLEAVYESVKSIRKESKTGSIHRINDNYATVFYREVEQNIAYEEGEKKGRIVLTPIYLDTEEKTAWKAATAATIGIPALVGMPNDEYEAVAELEVRITDNKGNVIRKYSAEQNASELVSLWGYDHRDASDAAKMAAYKAALRKITYQIQADYDYLSQKLK